MLSLLLSACSEVSPFRLEDEGKVRHELEVLYFCDNTVIIIIIIMIMIMIIIIHLFQIFLIPSSDLDAQDEGAVRHELEVRVMIKTEL